MCHDLLSGIWSSGCACLTPEIFHFYYCFIIIIQIILYFGMTSHSMYIFVDNLHTVILTEINPYCKTIGMLNTQLNN